MTIRHVSHTHKILLFCFLKIERRPCWMSHPIDWQTITGVAFLKNLICSNNYVGNFRIFWFLFRNWDKIEDLSLVQNLLHFLWNIVVDLNECNSNTCAQFS
jgi:hypothetical protein